MRVACRGFEEPRVELGRSWRGCRLDSHLPGAPQEPESSGVHSPLGGAPAEPAQVVQWLGGQPKQRLVAYQRLRRQVEGPKRL
ncbi:hypothetical protein NDU88_001767 [Pleurodeles waltl]|uniref:Uncharacterized protein n=1 Tax=Pleurodeles waltl TaxID=8319 RepID=A0AAV7V9D5_PLEWA|nr:hypothetical protein NDU88_001767 [Pleurodeles waltl]